MAVKNKTGLEVCCSSNLASPPEYNEREGKSNEPQPAAVEMATGNRSRSPRASVRLSVMFSLGWEVCPKWFERVAGAPGGN